MAILNQEVEKVCKTCGELWPIYAFYKHATNTGGREGSCRACRLAKQQKYRRKNKEAVLARSRVSARKWYQRKENKLKKVKNFRDMRTKYPERNKARNELRNAVKAGKVVRGPCLVCGKAETEGHHPDHGFPLVVIWLCPRHHAEYHMIQKAATELKGLGGKE